RITETWAHSHDVAEALGLTIPPTSRARHVCHIGVRARGFAYLGNGLELPSAEIRVEVTGAAGDVWTGGAEEGTQRVTGSGSVFPLLATRRRHLEDVDVQAEGDDAGQWRSIAQAFAGLPGNDPVRLADR